MDASREQAGSCPVCGEALQNRFRDCPTCETPHHPECWEWAGGCSIYGCSASPAARRAVTALVAAAAAAPALDAQTSGTIVVPAPAEALGFRAPLMQTQNDPLPPALAPLWWSMLSMAFFLMPQMAALAAMAPFGMSSVTWRFRTNRRVTQQTVRVMGLPVWRRRIPFADILRLEVRDDEATLRLVLVKTDGSSVLLSHELGQNGMERVRLRKIARGVQVHTDLHVTSALRLDPVTAHKRLESLRAAQGAVTTRMALVTAVAQVTSAAIAPLAWWRGANAWAVGAAALAWFLGAFATVRLRSQSDAFAYYFDEGLLKPSMLVHAERELRGRQLDPTGTGVAVAGHAVLLALVWLLAGINFGRGPGGMGWMSALAAAVGAAVTASSWARALLLQHRIAAAELGKDDRPVERIEAEMARAVRLARDGQQRSPELVRLQSLIDNHRTVSLATRVVPVGTLAALAGWFVLPWNGAALMLAVLACTIGGFLAVLFALLGTLALLSIRGAPPLAECRARLAKLEAEAQRALLEARQG